jgi:hypothetical protein
MFDDVLAAVAALMVEVRSIVVCPIFISIIPFYVTGTLPPIDASIAKLLKATACKNGLSIDIPVVEASSFPGSLRQC